MGRGRPATGNIVKPTEKQPSFALRFTAYGNREYLTLGRPEDGWTLLRAERELAAVLRDVELGTWQPSRRQPPQPQHDPRFLEFASDWFALKRFEIEPNTARSYRNDLTNHLLPFFAEHRISEFTIAEVDRYREHKVKEKAVCQAAVDAGRPLMVEIVDKRGRRYNRVKKPLSARSINMQIDVLEQILEVAVERDLLPSNPAKGRRRRLKVSKARPVYLDSAEHIQVMLEAADELDRDPTSRTQGRRAAIALLMLGGPRASAAGSLLERDVDLANGRFTVMQDKTDAGMREVDMFPLLREILTEYRAQRIQEGLPTGPNDPLLITATGKPRDRHNLRQRVVAPVVAKAEDLLARRGGQPLPQGISPHKLRHTFASVLSAISKDPAYVMHQLGHTDPTFTLRVYTHVMSRSPREREMLKALVEGHDWTADTDLGEDEAEQP
jgi:integrase